MNLFEAIVLGFFQGVAEFLPISSSGHLVILQRLFKIEEGNMFYAEMLHFGTLLSILFVYRNTVYRLIVEFFALVKNIVKEKRLVVTNKYQKIDLMIIIGTIPTVLIALVCKDLFDKIFSSTLPVGIAFLVTGLLLYFIDRQPDGHKNSKEMTAIDALVIGVLQGIAIIPGISRSGSTISASLYRGLKRPLATEYSFLFALPVTFGAFLMGLKDAASGALGPVGFSWSLVVGVFVSFLVGVVSLKGMIRLLMQRKLYLFSYYLWGVGALTILLSLTMSL